MSDASLPRRPRSAHGRLILVAALLHAAPGARAAFQYPQSGARSAAMSGASIPAHGDCAALFQNAAGVAGLEAPEAYMMYDRQFAGLAGVDAIGRSFITAAAPTRLGAIGVGLSDFKAAGLLNERIVGVGLSRRVAHGIDAGVTAKYLYHRYAPGSDQSAAGDPVFAGGTSRGGAAFDAGLIATLGRALKAGFAVRNINSPDLGLVSEDRVPREYQAGLSYDKADWLLKTTAEIVYRDNHEGTLRDRAVPTLGLEKARSDERVKFRLGVGLDQLSAGVGLEFGRLSVDYAFLLTRHLLTSSAGSHLIGVRYRFAGKP